MGIIKIGSSANRKGITVDPSVILFNGNNVKKIMSGAVTVWEKGIAWFKNGIFYNTNIFGTPKFYTQTNGTNNSSSYASDEYILLSNNGSSGNLVTTMFSGNKIPRNTYSKIKIKAKCTDTYASADEYKLHFGFYGSNNSFVPTASEMKYNYRLTTSNDVQTITMDLSSYNASGSDLYFACAGIGTIYIYEIAFQ